jgi:hypothetical protein
MCLQLTGKKRVCVCGELSVAHEDYRARGCEQREKKRFALTKSVFTRIKPLSRRGEYLDLQMDEIK